MNDTPIRSALHSRALKLFGLLLTAFALASCSQDDVAPPGSVAIEVLAVAAEVETVTLEVNGTTYTESTSGDAESGSVTFSLVDLPLGSTTFVARGLSSEGIVLYKASETVDLTDRHRDGQPGHEPHQQHSSR